MNSRTKDKIYALLSFLSIVLTIGSFVAVVGFLVKTNEYIFSVNEKTVKEKTTTVDKARYETIEVKLNSKKSLNTIDSQPQVLLPEEKDILESLEAGKNTTGLSSDDSLTLSPSPSTAPVAKKGTKNLDVNTGE